MGNGKREVISTGRRQILVKSSQVVTRLVCLSFSASSGQAELEREKKGKREGRMLSKRLLLLPLFVAALLCCCG